jgi:nitrous oxidase accessory protein
MKKIVFSFTLLAIVLSASAKTIRVGGNHAIKQIKAALLAAQDGDTVIVSKGLYKEGNLVISKSITFLGEDIPILDGDRKFEVLSVKASYVEIRGFRIQHSSYATLDDPGGVKVYDSNNVTIADNLLFDNFFGVYIQFGKNCIIKIIRLLHLEKKSKK